MLRVETNVFFLKVPALHESYYSNDSIFLVKCDGNKNLLIKLIDKNTFLPINLYFFKPQIISLLLVPLPTLIQSTH